MNILFQITSLSLPSGNDHETSFDVKTDPLPNKVKRRRRPIIEERDVLNVSSPFAASLISAYKHQLGSYGNSLQTI